MLDIINPLKYRQLTIEKRIILSAFISGFSSLSFQVIWQKRLGILLGINHETYVAVVTAFMVGLGFGAIATSSITNIRTKQLIYVFSSLEALVAIFGFFSNSIIEFLYNFTLINGLANFSSFISILLFSFPCFLMGMTFPLLTEIFARITKKENDQDSSTEPMASIYSVNILGAALGIYLTGVFLIGIAGLNNVTNITSSLNMFSSFLIISLNNVSSFSIENKNYKLQDYKKSLNQYFKNQYRSLKNPSEIILPFFVGFIMLGIEFISFRSLSILLGPTTYVFPTILFSYLLILSLGTFLFKVINQRFLIKKNSKEKMLLISKIITFTLVIFFIGIIISSRLPWLLNQIPIPQFLFSVRNFSNIITFIQLANGIFISFLALLPVIPGALMFPLVVEYRKLFTKKKSLSKCSILKNSEIGYLAGDTYFFQSMGNISGSLMTGFIFLPLKGVGYTYYLLSFLTILCIFFAKESHLKIKNLFQIKQIFNFKKYLWQVCLILMPLIIGRPENYNKQFVHQTINTKKVYPKDYFEDSQGTTFIYPQTEKKKRIEVYTNRAFNNSFPLKGNKDSIYTKFFPFDIIYDAGLKNIENILYVGMGSGESASLLLDLYPNANLTIVELNKRIVEIAIDTDNTIINNLFKSKRVNFVIDDGRRYLMRNRDKFDLIHVGLYSGWAAGNGNVLSKEFINLAYSKLKSRGVFVMNAYPSSVNAAFDLGYQSIILSPGTERISELIITKNNSLLKNQNSFRDISNNVKSTLRKISPNPDIDLKNAQEIRNSSCIISKGSFTSQKYGYKTATDNNLTGEYFLTSQFLIDPFFSIKPKNDLRFLSCKK